MTLRHCSLLCFTYCICINESQVYVILLSQDTAHILSTWKELSKFRCPDLAQNLKFMLSYWVRIQLIFYSLGKSYQNSDAQIIVSGHRVIVGLLLGPFQMILLCIEILVNNTPVVSFTGMRGRQVCFSGVYIPISPFLSSDPCQS